MNTNENSIQPVDFNRSLNEQIGTATADVVFVKNKANQKNDREQIGDVLVDQPHNKLRGPNLQSAQFHSYTKWLADILAPPFEEESQEVIDRQKSDTSPEPDSRPAGEPAQSMESTRSVMPSAPQDRDQHANNSSIVKKLVARLKNSRITTGSNAIRLTPNMWEVDSFTWPRQTDELLAMSAKSMEILADASYRLLTSPNVRLAFAGASPQSGTTTLMASVGRVLAAKGKRVLMIDANFANPELSNRLNLSRRISWLDAVRRKQDANQSIVRGLRSNICVMPLASLGARTNWPNFILDWLGDIVNDVKSRFDVVLIDVGSSHQMMQELSQCNLLIDAAVLVNNVSSSQPHDLGPLNLSLNDFGLSRFVIADNHVGAQQTN